MKLSAILILLFVANSLITLGQITIIGDSEGCSPLTGVVFESPVSGKWDFGNGQGNPFSTGGTTSYNATKDSTFIITFIDGVNFDTTTTTVTVFGNPMPDFSVDGDSSGCPPFEVSFKDKSSSGSSSNIVKWKWVFGDGESSVIQNPNHIFSTTAEYPISLTVEDDRGCEAGSTKNDYISVSNPPIVNFTATPSSSCAPPLEVMLTNNSSDGNGGTSGLEYNWDFGNTQTSTNKNPEKKTYLSNGNFTIKLTVLKDGGCPRSQIQNINVGKPESIIESSDTICINSSTQFMNKSKGGTSYKWTFNDGGVTTTSNSKNPFSIFNSAGNQTVTLIVNDAGCSDTSTKIVFVQDPQINLSGNPSYQCDKPFCVQFTATGEDIDTWSYEFGDPQGETSTDQNPEYCYDYLGGDEYTVYYYKGYKHTTKVTGTTKFQCKVSATFRDTIFPISANFAPNITQGCAPLEVTFQDSSASGSSIISYSYDFDDGSKSSSDSVSHTFSDAGEYNVTLTIENENGCKNTSFPIQIQIGDTNELLDLDIEVSPNIVCIGDTVLISDATGDVRIDDYHFSTDENRGSESCPSDSVQHWSYFHKTGKHDITFSANYNGCIKEKIFTDIVTVRGPSSSFKWSGNCSNPRDILFQTTVSDADSIYWDFGDGKRDTLFTRNINDTSITHSYDTSGDYTVILISKNNSNGCGNDTNIMLIKVRMLEANINGDSLICAGNFTVSGGSSKDVEGDCNNSYRWDYGDGTPMHLSKDSIWSTALNKTGPYTIRLMVYDVNGCRDTAEKEIVITKLYAGFKVDKNTGCLPLTINFTDTSQSATKLETWNWDFKDGNFGNGPTTSNEYTSSSISDYYVTLNVTDSLGCKDEASLRISPIIPDSTFKVTDPTICVGDEVTFTLDYSNSVKNASWDFGDGGTSAERTPTYKFDTSGNYTINVQITDTNDCKTQKTEETFVLVEDYPTAGFSSDFDTVEVICSPANITFTDTSIVQFGVTSFKQRKWDFNTSAPIASNETAVSYFDEPKDYPIKLTVETSNGCVDSAFDTITVVGPVADFTMSDSIICVDEEVIFDIKDSSDIHSYIWTFGDGKASDTIFVSDISSSVIKNLYDDVPSDGDWTIDLTLFSKISKGKVCSYVVNKNIEIHQVEADFNIEDSTVCITDSVVIENNSQATANTQYDWDFGNGMTSSVSNPLPQKYNSSEPDEYNISLILTNSELGCADTLIKKFILNPLPNVSALGGEVCFGDTLLITASGANSYLWSDTNNIQDVTKDSTYAFPNESAEFSVIGTDTNSCNSSAVISVSVIQEQNQITERSCIIIGDSATIGFDYGPGFSYSWTADQTENFLTCLSCPTQTVRITEEVDSIIYYVEYSDPLTCFTKTNQYTVCVEDKYTVDVPSAFTPDGAGENDIVYVKGHGIKELIYFRIYNRWGELVFETNELTQGWDGIYKDNKQGIETFVYQAKVKFYNDLFEEKAGEITLIR